MHAIDRAILELCLEDFHLLRPAGSDRSGPLYRHVLRLVNLGWLQKQGSLYKTTEAGRRQLIEAQSQRLGRRRDTLFASSSHAHTCAPYHGGIDPGRDRHPTAGHASRPASRVCMRGRHLKVENVARTFSLHRPRPSILPSSSSTVARRPASPWPFVVVAPGPRSLDVNC